MTGREQAPEPSFEEVLADPLYQSGFDHELLPHLVVERCHCAAVHIGPCGPPRGRECASDDRERQSPRCPRCGQGHLLDLSCPALSWLSATAREQAAPPSASGT